MAFKDLNIDEYLKKLDINPDGQALIKKIITSDPARNPQSVIGNVVVHYPSIKMGCVIKAESRKLEYSGILEHEYNPQVLGYLDQPHTYSIHYKGADNKSRIKHKYTPDMVVFEQDRIIFEEWKPEHELIRLESKNPNRYFKDQHGVWHCPPFEQVLAKYGFHSIIRTDKSVDYIQVGNIRFLEDFMRPNTPPVAPELIEKITATICDNPGISTGELIQEHSYPADAVYTMIVRQQIYVDLTHCPLSQMYKTAVFPDGETGRSYELIQKTYNPDVIPEWDFVSIESNAKLVWDGVLYTIINPGVKNISLVSDDGKLIDMNRDAVETYIKTGKIKPAEQTSPKNQKIKEEGEKILRAANIEDHKVAQYRLNAIAKLVAANITQVKTDVIPERTLRSWAKKYREAERCYGNGYIGLIPLHTKERKPQLLQEVVDEILNIIDKKYKQPTSPSKYSVFNQANLHLERLNYKPISYPTFVKILKSQKKQDQEASRKGKIAAYVYEPVYLSLEYTTPVHGEYSGELLHVDHTQLDIFTRSSITGEVLGKSWATFGLDAYDRRLSAMYMTYDSPSAESVLMLIRDYVRRTGMLPSGIVVDRGKEFHSIWFEAFLAFFNIRKFIRPPKKPRFGNVIERLWGTAHTEFIYNLIGNSQATKDRTMTPEVDPRNLAVWTLPRLYQRLEEWGFEKYNHAVHPALGLSPQDFFERKRIENGIRAARRISYDKNFYMMTLPWPDYKDGKRNVEWNIGVQIDQVYYNSKELMESGVINQEIEVRYDPIDIGVAYAYINNHWIDLRSKYYHQFKGHTHKEKALATIEIKAQNTKMPDHRKEYGAQLAAFLEDCHNDEVFLKKQLVDLENGKIAMYVVSDVISYHPHIPKPVVDALTKLGRDIDTPADRDASLIEESAVETPPAEKHAIDKSDIKVLEDY